MTETFAQQERVGGREGNERKEKRQKIILAKKAKKKKNLLCCDFSVATAGVTRDDRVRDISVIHAIQASSEDKKGRRVAKQNVELYREVKTVWYL